MNLKSLICSAGSGDISLTKLWANVAYLSATFAFNYGTIAGAATGGVSAEKWLIFLAVVGSHATASKWIAMKYGGDDAKD